MRAPVRRIFWVSTACLAVAGWAVSPIGPLRIEMGLQPDGTFIVSSGQRILPGTIAYDQRLSDLALSPDGSLCAVVAKSKVFLVEGSKIVEGSDVDLGGNAGFHGVAWTPDNRRLIVSMMNGHLQTFQYVKGGLVAGAKIDLKRPGYDHNPVPGGMCVSKDGNTLFVACVDLGAIVEVNLTQNARVREFATQVIPFTVQLANDEKTLIASNWGGEAPDADDLKDESENVMVKVNAEGSAATGTVSIIDRSSGDARPVSVGIHPTGIAVDGNLAYVANAMSDSISVIDIAAGKVVRTFEMKFKGKKIIGAMPNEILVRGSTLYTVNGGDNALCEIDAKKGTVRGYRPAGYFPTAVKISPDGKTAWVVNTKGNGSVKNSVKGAQRRNTHDFQGTVSVIDLTTDLAKSSALVAQLNSWDSPQSKPDLKVYKGGIKHVIYVIKENRTYDEIFGDLPIGNGDPGLASLGKTVMPNHQKLAKEFGLFDNAYTCGTNSADGHQWCDQGMANEYLEHFYVGYSRTYPDDGEDAMALNSTGRIWDAAMKAGKTVRVYGEWAGDDQAVYEPRKPKDWFEAWEDRQNGTNIFKYKAHTRVGSLKPILCPDYHYWPLIQSDQGRIDVFEKEFKEFVKNGNLPNLIVMSLPSDHSEGVSQSYPTPRSMMADNDYALGRLVETVSHSPYWKDTAIFVTQDDSQSGPDHVDGHRSLCLAISPYSKRGTVNSEFTTQVRTLRTIEDMLGLKQMNKFDTIARPMTECWTDTPDLTPYDRTPNIVPLGERNPKKSEMTAAELYWAEKSEALDWSGIDRADWYWLNRIVWFSIHKGSKPYPDQPTDRPGMIDTDD